jgi:hypothetical protein
MENNVPLRRAKLSDFMDNEESENSKDNVKKYNKSSQTHSNDFVEKNQQEFGQRKRIKP